MAVANLASIAETLIAGGRDPQTGAAIVENASLPLQRVVRCRLGELGRVAQREAVVPPAVVLIGDVVRVK
jgi:uroporphyrin-III C-methyltransferase/precorrin-2 dehydrogenase/sirohydrochlorin ferrochelatase